MGQPVLIKVLGFTDVERHAINSLFRLSQERALSYALWQPQSRIAPHLLLMDGQSHEAGLELAARALQAQELAAQGKTPVNAIWVAAEGAAEATTAKLPGIWRSFPRPVHWPALVQALDALFAPVPELEADFVLEASADADAAAFTAAHGHLHETLSDDLPTQPGAVPPRALVLNASLEKRYYLRSVLALAGWPVADEAANAANAAALLRASQYSLVILDLDLPERSGWQLLSEIYHLQAVSPALLAATTARTGLLLRWRAWRQGVTALWLEPFDSRFLQRKLLALDDALLRRELSGSRR